MSKLKAILTDILDEPWDKVHGAAGFKSLASWDSLKHIQLVAAIEENYSLSLSPEEILNLSSVSKIEALLQSKGHE